MASNIQHRMLGYLVNSELEPMQKETIVTWFKALSRRLFGEENHETLSESSQSRGRDLNPGPPEYEAGVPDYRRMRVVCHHDMARSEVADGDGSRQGVVLQLVWFGPGNDKFSP
jgi:hypothetical protein